jgi:predicted transcriptional regulator
MADSMSEYLKQDMECEGLLECIHGLKNLDKEIFAVLTEQTEPLTVDEVNYEQGGYYHVYRPTDPDEIADDMQRMLNDWYAKMGQLIGEFRTKYDSPQDQTVAAEN